MRDNLTFCSFIMFMIEVIYADQNIKDLLVNHWFNHVGRFLTSSWLSFIIVIELFAFKKVMQMKTFFQTSCKLYTG